MKALTVKTRCWHQPDNLKLNFPARWDVHECRMQGHARPKLSAAEIEAALADPKGTGRLADIAAGKKKVAVIFDDISRPTPIGELLPPVLKELAKAGIPDSAIRLVCALGCHGAHTYQDFAAKLGTSILNRFPVYNHNVYENCVDVGTTSQGTKLKINAEVMSCDLKIGIGSVITHPQTGFGGGGKIILPGVAEINSIEAYHRLEFAAKDAGRGHTVGMGNYAENPMLKDFTEAAKLAGLDFKMDCIVNAAGEVCALFCGDPEQEHRAAIQYAVKHYATEAVPQADIVVANTYAKENEAMISLIIGITLLAQKSGHLVMIMDCPTGQVVHYLLGSFGEDSKGRLFQAINFDIPWLKKVLIMCPQFEFHTADWIALPRTTWVPDWKEALKILEMDYPGDARVAVVPDGTIQYIPS
jgi:nickel-dependent lactate racemase